MTEQRQKYTGKIKRQNLPKLVNEEVFRNTSPSHPLNCEQLLLLIQLILFCFAHHQIAFCMVCHLPSRQPLLK
jgi:hypothetical protein